MEKSRKKELKKLTAQRQRDVFEKSLPMSRAEFERLFEFLGEGLAHRGCDGTHSLTLEFLRAKRRILRPRSSKQRARLLRILRGCAQGDMVSKASFQRGSA
nr:hypothetical protein [uncultured Campylobacter sp.]